MHCLVCRDDSAYDSLDCLETLCGIFGPSSSLPAASLSESIALLRACLPSMMALPHTQHQSDFLSIMEVAIFVFV